MIVDNGQHYIYRHVRLDSNQPFYIGMGCKKDRKKFTTFETEYERAFDRKGRNNYWHNIVNKHNYKVEILLESDSYEFIIKKEIELIALYGRENINTGILCNMTDGGEGNRGLKMSKESKKLMSDKAKKRIGSLNSFYGKKHGDSFRAKKYKPVLQFTPNGEFIKEYSSLQEASLVNNLDTRLISRTCREKSNEHGGFIWIYKKAFSQENLEKRIVISAKNRKPIKVYKIDSNGDKTIYNSISDANKITGESKQKIAKHAKGDLKRKGFEPQWFFLED